MNERSFDKIKMVKVIKQQKSLIDRLGSEQLLRTVSNIKDRD